MKIKRLDEQKIIDIVKRVINEGSVKKDNYTLSDIEKTIKLSQTMVYSDLEQTEKDFKYSPNEIIDMVNDGVDEEPTHLMSFEEELKRKLRILYKGTSYDTAGIIEQRIEQLLSIHKKWLDSVKQRMSSQIIADTLFNYEKKLNK